MANANLGKVSSVDTLKKYLDDHNVDYVKETQGSKRRMHTWQHKKIITYKETHGGMRPLLNKSDY